MGNPPSEAAQADLVVGQAPVLSGYVLRAQVDEEADDAVEKSFPSGLVADGVISHQLDDVKLKTGKHDLIVTVDAKNTVVESNEGNNALKIPLTSKNEDD